MNKQINSELASILKAHLSGQQDSRENKRYSFFYYLGSPIDMSILKSYRVAYYNPLNKTLSYGQKKG